MSASHDSMMTPRIEELLERAGSKFTLVALGSKRARQINAYFGQLGEGHGSRIPPQVTSVAHKPLSIAFEEIAADKIEAVDIDREVHGTVAQRGQNVVELPLRLLARPVDVDALPVRLEERDLFGGYVADAERDQGNIFVIEAAPQRRGMRIVFALVAVAQVRVRVEVQDHEIVMAPRKRPDRPGGNRVLAAEGQWKTPIGDDGLDETLELIDRVRNGLWNSWLGQCGDAVLAEGFAP